MPKDPLSKEQKDKLKKFIEEKKQNSKPTTIEGKNLNTGKPFKYTLYPEKESD